MKAVILCGGMGTRMREETEFRPKPMVRIGAKPILWHIMKSFAHYGYNEFVLCLGYKGDIIKEYFYHYMLHNCDVTVKLGRDGRMVMHEPDIEEDWTVTLVDTGEAALKGARIKRIEKYIDGYDFFVTYGDGVSNVNLQDLVDYHRSHGKIATVTGVSPRSSFGQLHTQNGKVLRFREKPQIEEGTVNGGFFVFHRRIFDYLTADDRCDFEVGPLEKVVEEGQLMVFHHKGAWACMDTFRDVEYMNNLWNTGQAFWKVW